MGGGAWAAARGRRVGGGAWVARGRCEGVYAYVHGYEYEYDNIFMSTSHVHKCGYECMRLV